MSANLAIVREAVAAPYGRPSILPDEYAVMLTEITALSRDAISTADLGSWPCTELDHLLGYLHLTLVRHLADEDWLLFRCLHHDDAALELLRQSHRQLRSLVKLLTDAANVAHQRPHLIGDMVRQLLATVRGHFARKSQLLQPFGDARTITSLDLLRYGCHAPLHGRVVDLDLAPGPTGVDALVAGIMRLARRETVEVHASSDLSPLSQYLSRVDPGTYCATPIENGPPRWRMKITRRPTR